MEIKNYKFREGFNWKVDPNLAGKAIEKIAKKHNGEITPTLVVESAKNERSPLHQCFDWDDKTAAEKHRLQQARMLLASLIVEVVINEPEQVRAFVSISSPESGPTYCSINSIVDDEEKLEIIIQDAKKRLINLSRQLSVFERLREVSKKIEDVANELN